MSSVFGKLQWSIQHRGLTGTLQAAAKGVGRRLKPPAAHPIHPFDLEHGTDTGGLIAGSDLASGHSSDRFIEGYAAVPPSRFHNILARWRASDLPYPITDYTFIDLGCGKGRAILLASEVGFREVVGVELNPSLTSIAAANANLWTAAAKARCPIRVERADALDFSWPLGSCVVFLFNPFGAVLMQRLANRLEADFRDRQADLDILYYKPEQAGAFEKSFEMIWREVIGISQEDLAVDPVADLSDETKAYRLPRRRM